MKKFFKYAVAIMAAALISPVFISCSSSDEDEVKNYDLTIAFQRSQELAQANIIGAKVTISNGSATETQTVTDLSKAITVNKPQGSYNITFSAKVDGEATAIVSGTAKAELYSNQTVTVQLQKGRQSTLVFKTIYTSAGAQYYMLDGFFEIVNNSDEVQYLDQLILSAPAGNQKQPNAWQANDITDLYESGQGAVIAFPGNGTDFPLQPGEFVVIANEAMNHKLAYGDDETKIAEYAKSPDLSNADWEITLGTGDVQNLEDSKQMNIIWTNNQYMKAWGIGVMGRSYLLAKLPAGMTPEQFAADENNLQTTPGTSATMQYLMIPSKYVLDAVDIYNPATAPEDHYCTFLPVDDATGIQGNESYQGLSVRRKVAKIENGRVYYKDTNSSADDFKNNQDNTPGVTPTEVDQ